MKRKRITFLVLVVVLSIVITWNIINKDFSSSEKDVIYSTQHLIFEFVIFVILLFFILEAWLHVKRDKNKSIRYNLNRYIRILLALGIIAVHVVVLIYGGYCVVVIDDCDSNIQEVNNILPDVKKAYDKFFNDKKD